MALNSANGVSDALELGWLIAGSLALGVTQLAAMVQPDAPLDGLWAQLAEVSPPLDADRPMAQEVRTAGALLAEHAERLLAAPDGN